MYASLAKLQIIPCFSLNYIHCFLFWFWPICTGVPAAPDLLNYLKNFVRSTLALGVPLFAVTHHEYIEVMVSSDNNPALMDETGDIAAAVNESIRSVSAVPQIWAGEIGPHNGGSPPCDHSSMRW